MTTHTANDVKKTKAHTYDICGQFPIQIIQIAKVLFECGAGLTVIFKRETSPLSLQPAALLLRD